MSGWLFRGAPPPHAMVLTSPPSFILLCSFLPSDYIIEEKAAVLQKREHEGFGFVLRGAKATGRVHSRIS
ncbi:UNVERIFIED_CONTAM: hypothetical protein K2H54_077661 [Gekko kuhli]